MNLRKMSRLSFAFASSAVRSLTRRSNSSWAFCRASSASFRARDVVADPHHRGDLPGFIANGDKVDAQPDLGRAEMEQIVVLDHFAAGKDLLDLFNLGTGHFGRKEIHLPLAHDLARRDADALRSRLIGVEQRSQSVQDEDDVPGRFRQRTVAAFAPPQCLFGTLLFRIDAFQGGNPPPHFRQFFDELLLAFVLIDHGRLRTFAMLARKGRVSTPIVANGDLSLEGSK